MKKSIAFALLLGIGVAAQAAPVKMLDLKEENGGCMTEDFQVKRGETYYFQHTVNQTLILTIRPINSRIVVKDPRGRRLTLGIFENTSYTEIKRQGRYSVTFPRAMKVTQLHSVSKCRLPFPSIPKVFQAVSRRPFPTPP